MYIIIDYLIEPSCLQLDKMQFSYSKAKSDGRCLARCINRDFPDHLDINISRVM